ncbi:MAG: hypothetical protein N2C14_17030, partial [Planctomycetales bacterium]
MKAIFATNSSDVGRFLLLCLAVSTVGCGTGEYNERMKKTIVKLKLRAKFDVLEEKPYAFPGAAVTIRLPTEFPAKHRFSGAYPRGFNIQPGPGKNTPNFFPHPVFVNRPQTDGLLPGLKLCVCNFLPDPEKKDQLYFCY